MIEDFGGSQAERQADARSPRFDDRVECGLCDQRLPLHFGELLGDGDETCTGLKNGESDDDICGTIGKTNPDARHAAFLEGCEFLQLGSQLVHGREKRAESDFASLSTEGDPLAMRLPPDLGYDVHSRC